jgi:hypothetical protein
MVPVEIIETPNLLITKQVLRHLSYTGKMERGIGIEPMIFGLADQCFATQLTPQLVPSLRVGRR